MQTYLNLEVSDDTSPIQLPQFQFQADTMQVPCGQHSILWALGQKEVTAAEAIVYLALNHASSWNSGQTWIMPLRPTVDLIGISKRYVEDIIKRMKNRWITPITTSRGNRYQLVHHLCDEADVPIDKDGKPLKFAVPRGDGGPFERLYAGDITWKDCLGWIVLKFYSDWKTGETYPCTMLEFAKRCRFRPATAVQSVKNLIAADMLHRLSKPNEKSVFQLYPKPHPQPEKREKQPAVRKEHGVLTDGTYWIANNEV